MEPRIICYIDSSVCLRVRCLQRLTYRALVLVVLCLLDACAPPHKAIVEERSVLTVRQESEKIGGQLIRIAQSGDTLHSIAFTSNLDVNKVAAWNAISDTSRLNVGQRIRLTKPIGFVENQVKKTVYTNAKPNIKSTSSSKKNKSTRASKAPGNTVVRNSTPNRPTGVVKVESKKRVVPTKANARGVRWSWPVNGSVIRAFSQSSTQQGIDILSTKGEVIKAAASGEVVYVGNSLKGYGNLIILKHNDEYLSAYAHNQNIFVREGQSIATKQAIGSIGSNNRRESAMHFQIRSYGRPVNPLNFLPERK